MLNLHTGGEVWTWTRSDDFANYMLWSPGDPLYVDGWNCTTVITDPNFKAKYAAHGPWQSDTFFGKWHNVDCSNKYPFGCMKDKDVQCPKYY